MAFTMEFTSTVHGVTYALTASPTALELLGAAEDGEIVAEGTIRLPPGAATEAAGLVRQALATIAIFEGKARPRVANSHARWTPDDDNSLRVDWLGQPSSTPAIAAIRDLAKARGRSPAAIRARLGRIGCDPDVAGRLLTPETAELLGRDAIAGAA